MPFLDRASQFLYKANFVAGLESALQMRSGLWQGRSFVGINLDLREQGPQFSPWVADLQSAPSEGFRRP